MTTPSLNPFKELRLSANITLELMSKKAGISKQALIRLEQGCYVEPLPTALSYFGSAFPVTEYQIQQDYEAFQQFKRALALRYFGDFTDKLVANEAILHPLRVLRGHRTLTEVAKSLCLPPATLTYFERNVVQQKSVPKALIQVLREIGYDEDEVDCFRKAYDAHRNKVIKFRTEAGKRVTYGYQSKRQPA